MKKPKVVISACWYAITAAADYIARGFRQIDCEVITVGPYPGLWMPWTKNGIAGVVMPDNYDCKPDIPLPYNGGMQTAPIGYIENLLPPGFEPDLWLDVNAGFYLEGTPKKGIRATFLTDPHTGLRNIYDSLKPQYQYVFCPQRVYAKENEYYLPYAADREWHTPIEAEKLYDVTLIGNYYMNRVELMQFLKNQGKRIFFDLGYAKEDLQRIYSQSLIGLNWSSMYDLTARVFEVASFGIAPVFNRVPDLPLLFEEGKDYLGFDNLNEAISQINWLLENPDDAKRIGESARKKIIDGGHTWDNRAKTMLEVCQLQN